MLMLLLLLDLGFIENTQQQQTIGESGGEDSEDEWNYIKGDKKSSEGLAAVEETSEVIESSSFVDKKEEFEQEEQQKVSFFTINFSKIVHNAFPFSLSKKTNKSRHQSLRIKNSFPNNSSRKTFTKLKRNCNCQLTLPSLMKCRN